MASLSSRAPAHPRTAQLTSDEDALAYSDQTPLSPRTHPLGDWRIVSNGEELWSEFEARRRSAEYYLNLYFECMDAISADSSRDYGTMDQPSSDDAVIHPQAPSDGPGNRDIIQLKIYRDTIIRELIAMEDIALYVQQAYASTDALAIAPTTTIWTLGCCLTAVSNSSAVIVCTSALGAIAGGIALAAPPAWRSYHKKELQVIVENLRGLKKTVADGLDPARHRQSLDASRFTSLERIAESTEVGSRVTEEP